MLFLKSFTLPDKRAEDDYILSQPYQTGMACFSHTDEAIYPFKLFPKKQLSHIEFEPITIFYGGNGSGKSTLLNVISEKIGIRHSSRFNCTNYTGDYLRLCSYEATAIPPDSMKVTSDDVFDYLLNLRASNAGITRKRDELFDEYYRLTQLDGMPTLKSMEDYDEFKIALEAQRSTKSQFVARRVAKETAGKSNGESAFLMFTGRIGENSLYVLDEPENSLSPRLQTELAEFLSDSARFYDCQFVISTHSPFLLSIKGAKIYDLDSFPARPRRWQELENIRAYYEFFKEHEKLFERVRS